MKTSQTDPLLIATMSPNGLSGAIGLTLCPGKKDPGRGWNRDLDTWPATTGVPAMLHSGALFEDQDLGAEIVGGDGSGKPGRPELGDPQEHQHQPPPRLASQSLLRHISSAQTCTIGSGTV